MKSLCFIFSILVTIVHAKTYFEGDILITKKMLKYVYGDSILDKLSDKIIVLDDKDENRRELALLNLTQYYWNERDSEDRIVLPWRYANASDFTLSQRNNIDNYMTSMESKLGVIKFVPYTSETDFIEIVHNDEICASYIGRIGGKQEIFFVDECIVQGIFEHEVLHAMGVFHEHTRYDRDNFVEIIEENIIEGYESSFAKRSPDHTDDLGVTYDYGSVMHYNSYAFSIDENLKTIDAGSNPIGQRDGMSNEDIEQIRLMYKCTDGPRHKSVFCSENCLCISGEGTCSSNSHCEGSLTCNNGICGTPRPTQSPVTLSPTISPAPTKSPTITPPTISINSNSSSKPSQLVTIISVTSGIVIFLSIIFTMYSMHITPPRDTLYNFDVL